MTNSTTNKRYNTYIYQLTTTITKLLLVYSKVKLNIIMLNNKML